MGYSCAMIAGMVHQKIIAILQGPLADDRTYPGNCWKVEQTEYMEERGREQADGAVTGTVYRVTQGDMAGTGGTVRKVGSYKISAEGRVLRFPSSTAKQREQAEQEGQREFDERMGRMRAVGAHL